jgi:hypothetical protein
MVHVLFTKLCKKSVIIILSIFEIESIISNIKDCIKVDEIQHEDIICDTTRFFPLTKLNTDHLVSNLLDLT